MSKRVKALLPVTCHLFPAPCSLFPPRSFGFDYARHLKHSVGAFGRVLEGGLMGEARAHFVGAQHVFNGQGVHGWLDIGGVEFA